VKLASRRTAHGAAGALIGTNVAGANLEDPGLRPFFAAASRLGAPLLVHAVDPLAPERLRRHYFANLVGNPYEAGLAVGSVIFGGLLDELPELRLVFCHAGGAAPALAGPRPRPAVRDGYAI
jgi:aminocarboxymuconate-semialdehyde decarboxylase